MTYPKNFTKPTNILLLLIAIVFILIFAKPFLVPLTFGAFLAMLLLPITKWLQSKGLHQVLAIILPILGVISAIALVGYFISSQISDIADNASELEQQITEKYQQLKTWLSNEYGISPAQQKQMLQQQQESSSGKAAALLTGIISGLGSILTNFLLVLVYAFLFIFFRSRIKGFILRLVPHHEKENTKTCIQETQKVAQEYLKGLSLMIICLWIMYGIGFTIAGVKNAFFFAILCGLLEIIPFVGNLTGTALTVMMSLVQGGDMNLVIYIIITYGLIQFIQTYLLEPLVVGAGVSINPMATIIGLIAAELIWGIPGMVVAIPIMGMMKTIFEYVPVLQPYAYLIGQEKKENDNIFKKLAQKFKRRS